MTLPLPSVFFYNICTLGYIVALFCMIANVAWKKTSLHKLSTLIIGASFIIQVIGLVIRWHEGGLVEVAAAERALGQTLQGSQWFVIYTQHPPWSNLYEILVYMSWGLVLVYLVTEVLYRIPLLGIIVILLALTTLGMASLTADATIKPLVPALQSWWIMVHVISSAIGYAAGTLAAIASFMYLIKAQHKISLARLAAGVLVLNSALLVILGRGAELFTTGQYRVKLMKESLSGLFAVGRTVGEQSSIYYTPSPGVGILMIVAILLSIVAAWILWTQPKNEDQPQKMGTPILSTCLGNHQPMHCDHYYQRYDTNRHYITFRYCIVVRCTGSLAHCS
jgi:ABC-type transport system involved in cytochrome c biogenesis permease subunit